MLLGNSLTGLQFTQKIGVSGHTRRKSKFIITLSGKLRKSYKPLIVRECSYSIYLTWKREYESNREKTSEKESRFIKCDEPAHGASGDIGFTPKASKTNVLRAIEQQYLHQNRISALDFEGVPVTERPFSLPKNRVRKTSPLTKCFRTLFCFCREVLPHRWLQAGSDRAGGTGHWAHGRGDRRPVRRKMNRVW